MTLVVDASVAVKWLFSEVFSDAAERLLRPGCKLLVPDLLWAEVASAACKKVRRKEAPPDKTSEGLKDLRRLPIKTYPSTALIQTALNVALEAGLSVYDAIYLALSYDRECPLITADRKLYDRIFEAYPQSETLWLDDIH